MLIYYGKQQKGVWMIRNMYTMLKGQTVYINIADIWNVVFGLAQHILQSFNVTYNLQHKTHDCLLLIPPCVGCMKGTYLKIEQFTVTGM
jgi:hypothetical protein